MADMRDVARDPEHRRNFEKLLYLAAQRGDADLVAERLSWGIDPDCRSAKKHRTPLMANVCGSCPSAATVRALLASGADPGAIDLAGLTALDHARRKLARLRAHPPEHHKSPSLDENNQLQLSEEERAELDRMREELGADAQEFLHIWWQERLRAARRGFNDPEQVEQIVAILEASGGRDA
jgi:hypothetical protein